jgi:hypothetical protein
MAKLRQASEVFQPGIRQPGGAERKSLKVRQGIKVRQSSVCDFRTADVQVPQLL